MRPMPGRPRGGQLPQRQSLQDAAERLRPIQIEVPRDRDSSFDPKLVKKRQRRLEGFDDKVLALYARGLSTRDIQGQLEELYGVDVSPAFDLQCHRRGHGRRAGLAIPAAVGRLPDPVL